MRIMRMECKCKVPGCSLQFKVHKCDFDETHVFYMRGFDVHTHKQMLKGDVAEGASKNTKNRSNGIHISYKAAVMKVLDEEPEMTAKKIAKKLKNYTKIHIHIQGLKIGS